MKREDEIRKELEEIAPFLSELKKENPFEVPYGYFDKMQREVLEKTIGEASSSSEVPALSWYERLLASFAFMLRPRVAMGGLAIALVAWSALFLWQQGAEDPTLAADQEWVAEANAYIAANIDDFDDEFLLELVVAEERESEENGLEGISEDDPFIDEVLDELDGVDLEDLL